MDLMNRLSLLSPLDLGALATVVVSWYMVGWLIEHPSKTRPSVTVLMAQYRRAWMREMVTREPRIFDAQILSSLRQGTSFFASSCILAIGGVLALIGNTERLSVVAADLTQADIPALVWQVKLLVVALFLTNGFLKFVWANRLFGYCSVMMAAVSNDPDSPEAYPRAAQAGELNIRAAWNFNRGLRSLYFALSSLAWLLGPIPLLLATALTLWVLWEREFASLPRQIILGEAQVLKQEHKI
jgi:uncharacterized membrane protein